MNSDKSPGTMVQEIIITQEGESVFCAGPFTGEPDHTRTEDQQAGNQEFGSAEADIKVFDPAKIIGDYFVRHLADRKRDCKIFWDYKDSILKIYTVISNPNHDLESLIYNSELQFMDNFPDINCEFCVLYLIGKNMDEVLPEGMSPVQ